MTKTHIRAAAVLAAVALTACKPAALEQSTTAPKPNTAGITQQTLPEIGNVTQNTVPTAFAPQAPGTPPPLPEQSDIDPITSMTKLSAETLHGVLYALTQTNQTGGSEFANAYLLGVTQYRAAQQGVADTFNYSLTDANAVLAKAQLTIDDVSPEVALRNGEYVTVSVVSGALTDFKPDLVSREVNDKYSGTGQEYTNVYAYVTAAGTATRVTLITLEDGADVSVAGIIAG
ncbi:hypothetical protein FACS1894133_3420 [Clostridia bacterium]|nr:hypothetical protein FACS1894133_3420 [Clostridia bacterium]